MKRFTTILTFLMLVCMGIWAEEVTLTPAKGTYVTGSGNYVNSISFSTTPAITITASANNMDKRQTGSYLLWHSGQSGSSTYTISVPVDWCITAYTVTGEANTSAQTLTAGAVSHEFAVGTSSSFTVSDLSSNSVSYVQTGANASGLKITSITVTLKPWNPSLEKNLVIVGETVTSISPVTDPSDNSKWYLLTQVRNGESPMYDVGTGNTLKRASASVTPASLSGSVASGNAYLIRFVSVSEGTYNIQFANGNWITNDLKTATSKASAGTYAFYNCNGGSGSYFAWNKNSKSGNRVDNNGAGNTLAFYESGEVSGTSGNNVWYVYEVDFEEGINVTYNLYESDGETLVSSQTVLQHKSSEITVPASLKNGYLATDYDYATSGTIGTTDCSIKVTRTLKANGNTPSLTEGAYMRVGSAATSMIPATSATDNDHWYLVTQTRGSSGSYTPIYNVSTYSIVKRATSSVTNVTLNEAPLSANEKYLVRFIETGESTGLYYMQFADGNYITSNLTTAQTVNSAGTFAFYKVTGGTYGGDDKFGWNLNSNTGSRVDNNGAGDYIAFWGSGTNDGSGENSVWTIYPVELTVPSYFVQYEISDASGVVYTSVAVPASLNDVITTLPAAYQRDYCSYDVTETTVTSSGVTTVPVTVSYDLPFTVSADYSTATWYSAYFRGTKNSAYYITSTSGTSYSTSTTKMLSDAAMWAFTGNPYDGFKIMNKAKGDGYFLGYDATSDGADLYMKSTGNAFQLKHVTGYSSFCFYIENTNTVVHDFSHKLSFWNHNNAFSDEGSGWTIKAESEEYASALSDLYDELKSVIFGEEIGRYTWGGSGTAEEARANITGAGSVLENHLTSLYKECYDALLDISANITLNTPAAGFYRLKNVATGQYLNAVSGPYSYTQSIRGVYANGSNSSAATVIELRESGGNLYMYNQGSGFGWVYAGVEYSSGGVGYLTSNPDKYVNWFPGTAAGQIAFAICLGNGTGNYASCLKKGIYAVDTADKAVVGGTNETADVAQWIVEAATTVTIPLTTIGNYAYATTCLPFDVTITSGANAYVMAESGEWLVPTQLTDNKVPAGTPVLLRGTSGTESATATINTGAAFAAVVGNVLSGTYLAKDFALTDGATAEYFLGKKNGVLGFYHSGVVSKTDYYTLGANKAYLSSGAGARGFAIMWDENETTGVNEVIGKMSEVTDGAIYDLQGRKVANPSRGMYIVNGRKVVVK